MKKLPFHGFREVAAVVRGASIDLPLKSMLDIFFVHQPRMTGWPPWVDSRGFQDEAARPYVRQRGWEALIYDQRPGWSREELDFWRMEPTARFYAARTYEDDTSTMLLDRGSRPGTVFDFVMLISRTAELIGTVRAFVDGLYLDRESIFVDFAFRWTGLKDRQICSWAEPMRSLLGFVSAEDDEAIAFSSVPQDMPNNLIWQVVQRVTQPVFDVFGAGVGPQVYEDLVNRTLNRQL